MAPCCRPSFNEKYYFEYYRGQGAMALFKIMINLFRKIKNSQKDTFIYMASFVVVVELLIRDDPGVLVQKF